MNSQHISIRPLIFVFCFIITGFFSTIALAGNQQPDVPSGFTVPSTDGDGSYTISWNSVTLANEYKLQERVDGGGWTTYSTSSLSKSFSGKTDGDYDYRVQACSLDPQFTYPCSDYSVIQSLQVQNTPDAPSSADVPVGSIDGNYTLTWGSASGDIERYETRQSVNGGAWDSWVNQGTAQSKFYSGRPDGNYYKYQVRACNTIGGCGSETQSNTVTIQSIPNVPTSFSLTPSSNVQALQPFTLDWDAPAGVVDGYDIYEQIDGGSWHFYVSKTTTDHTTSPGKSTAGNYCYKVRSTFLSTESTDTASQCFSPVLPGQPSDLDGPLSSDTGDYTLTWTTAITGDISYYELQEVSETGLSFVNTGSNAGYYIFTNKPNGGYVYQGIRACNAYSACSAWVSTNHQLVVSRTVTTAPPPDLSDPTDDPEAHLGPIFNGLLAGSANVTRSGTGAYSIPIQVPPGTAGMEPSLSLNYSSQGGNSLLGVGWSLSGISNQIHRCNKTIVQDNEIHGVDYSTDDRLCLNGQRLLLHSGVYHSDGSEYRTAINQFSRITASGSAGNSVASFSVETKSNLILHYGASSDSRIEAEGSSEIRLWLLNKIEDQSGNYYTISYYEDNPTGEVRPIQIDYTGNDSQSLSPYASVQFSYENRIDTLERFQAGSLITTSQRLSHIKTYVGATLVKDYQLSYSEESNGKHSRISSIVECNGQSDCKSALTLDWEAGSSGSLDTAKQKTISSSGDYSGYISSSSDLNNDGIGDLLWTQADSSGFVSAVALSNGDGTFQNLIDDNIDTDDRSSYSPALTGDFDGDGIKDLVWTLNTSAVGVRACISLGNGDGTFQDDLYQAPTTSGDYSSYANAVSGDFDGDGRTDIAWTLADVYGLKADVALATTNGNLDSITTNNLYSGDFRQYIDALVADANSDGLDDLIWTRATSNSGLYAYVALSNGDGTFQNAIYNQPRFIGDYSAYNIGAGDLNGDGATDLYWTAATNNSLYVITSLSMGDGNYGYGVDSNIVNSADFSSYDNAILDDFNHDGKKDLAWALRDSSNPGLTVYLSLGSGDGTFEWASYHPLQTSGPYDTYNPTSSGDFNGDGITDLIWTRAESSSSGITAYLSLAGNNGHIKQINYLTDGLGNTTDFTYLPLTDSNVYSKSSESLSYPTQHVQDTRYVVSQLNQSDGIGDEFVTHYTYSGLKREVDGTGEVGYAKFIQLQTDRDIRSETDYHQTFPYIGLITQRKTYLDTPNRLLSEIQNNYLTEGIIGTEPVFTYLDSATSKRYDPNDGRLLSTITKTILVHDIYGNIADSKTVVTDHENANKTYETQTTLAISNFPSTWWLGRIDAITQTATVGGINEPNKDRYTELSYYTSNRLMHERKIEPGAGAPIEQTISYIYDGFGNVDTETVSAPDITTRTTRDLDYDTRGQFATTIKNALNYSETRAYDDRFGVITSLTGPNGLSTTWTHDGFGRVLTETRPNGTSTTIGYYHDDSGNNPNSEYYINSKTSGITALRIFHDSLGRQIRHRQKGFDGTFMHIDKEYDSNGRIKQSSEPYYDGSTVYWNSSTFDVVGRTIAINAADSKNNITRSFDGFQITETDAGGNIKVITNNAIDQTQLIQDANLNLLTYEYDTVGNLEHIIKADGNSLENQADNTYDRLGRKLSTTDPDAGLIEYAYNGLGQLKTQTNAVQRASSQTTTLNYDLLGRLTSRIEPEGTTTWSYDDTTSGNLGIGKLHQESQTNFSRTYYYDSTDNGKLSGITTTIDSNIYNIDYRYDSNGQVDQITYPNSAAYPTGLVAEYLYNARGYLERVSDTNTNTVHYQTLGLDASSRISSHWLGDGSWSLHGYAAGSGRLLFTNSGTDNDDIQNLTYTYDNVGNLDSRSDLINNVSESFTYDDLNRITSAAVGTNIINYTYDALGNLTEKSDQGTLNYGNNCASQSIKPHAVCELRDGQGQLQNTYHYDANGNLTSDDNRTLIWSTYNKPTQITNGSITRSFSYGPDRARFKQTKTEGANSETTLYIGGLFEKIDDGTDIIYKHYIKAGSQTMAIINDTNGTATTRYIHKDRMGSITAITNNSGALIARMSHDSFGQRRDPTTWLANSSPPSPEKRGYTGHEHLDDVNLIHMNGRVYDPAIGRMMSVDPIVINPMNQENWNRYSYVLNNPLRYTDPSGFNNRQIGRGGDLERVFDGGVDLPSDGFRSSTEIQIFGYIGGIQHIQLPNGSWLPTFGNYSQYTIFNSNETIVTSYMDNGNWGNRQSIPPIISSGDGNNVNTPVVSSNQNNNATVAANDAGSNLGPAIPDIEVTYNPGFWRSTLDVLGKIWALPNTIIGAVYGGVGYVAGNIGYAFGWTDVRPTISFGNNAIQFHNNPLMASAMTFGNTIVYGAHPSMQAGSLRNNGSNTLGYEEMQHTIQSQVLGPLYFPAHIISGMSGLISNQDWHGPAAFLESGPHSENSEPW